MKKQDQSFQKFLLLWMGKFISAIGSGLTSFGLSVYVFEQTGKASLAALIALLAFLPSLLLSAVAGVLADRYDRRILMVLGDSLSALGLIYILICMLSKNASIWQICVGVTISSVFSSLLEPAYKATITDLLTKEQFTKASGLVQVAGSAKYLISPILAGYLLHISDIKLLLVLDIGTFFITVTAALVVRKGLKAKEYVEAKSFLIELKEGWRAVSRNKGVFLLVIMASAITLCLGFIQTLSAPMILAFSNSKMLGSIETISAMGMLVSSAMIGFFSIKKGYVKILSLSLFGAGIFMVLFGLRENVVLIAVAGFLFFMMLPFANTSLDYLIRTNIENDLQGRAWGFIGVISQLGYVVAYAISGVLADYVFTPLLLSEGILAKSIGSITGTGIGRGTGLLISLAGILLCVVAFVLYHLKAVKKLEMQGGKSDYVLQNNS